MALGKISAEEADAIMTVLEKKMRIEDMNIILEVDSIKKQAEEKLGIVDADINY